MKFCYWLGPLVALLVGTAWSRGGPLSLDLRHRGSYSMPAKDHAGYLAVTNSDAPGSSENVPYYPRAGDILLYDDMIKFHHFAFKIAGTGPPTHAAMVIEQNGKPALLELTGPTVAWAKVVIMEVTPRLESYQGEIMVRRLREPLTPEQSAELTSFAEAQAGKYMAYKRGLLQATPFCARTGLRRRLFGRTFKTRKRWFCSEIVVAGCCAAHILDPNEYPANAMYPRDLAYDETFNLSPLFHEPVRWLADASVTPGTPAASQTAKDVQVEPQPMAAGNSQ